MNRFFLNIIFFFLLQSLIGQQNLVPNGSFEEYSDCPTGNELNNGQFERAIGWFRPTFGTPDYYHRCNNNGSGTVGVPNNFWGHQEPYEGDGYIGFVPLAWNSLGEYTGYEYIRSKLLYPLKPCVRYYYRMFLSLANFSTHGVSEIGVWFSTSNLTYANDVPIIESPQITFQENPIIDTSKWSLFEGYFIAEGFEEYLTIGYFRNNVLDDTSFIQNNPFFGAPCYYVDSVSLVEVGPVSEEVCEAGEIIFPNIITPNNDNSNDRIDATPYFVITDEIVILNRWGNVITLLTIDNPIWDGTTQNGNPCSEGNYFYTFTYQWGTQLKEKSGFIQLVR